MSYKCIITNAIFKHIELENTRGKAFVYLKCGYRCNFNNHSNHHTGESTFKCTECDYKCNSIRHIYHYTGNFTYKYTDCDYRCNCNCHIEHHTGVKPLRFSIYEYRCKYSRFIRFENRFIPTKGLIHIRPFNIVKPLDAVFYYCYWLVIYVVLLFTNIYMLFSYAR